MLKVDASGNIYRPNGSMLGKPSKTGNIYRSNIKTGTLNDKGEVYNLKGELLGSIKKEKKTSKPVINNININTKKAPKKIKKQCSSYKNQVISPVCKISLLSDLQGQKKQPNYIPGKDSFLIVSGRLTSIIYPQQKPEDTDKDFIELNKSKNWHYKNWIQLIAKEDLTEDIIDKYHKHIDWYTLVKFHPEKNWSDNFIKKYAKQLAL